MQIKAQKWGNSLAVRIPKPVAEQAGVHENDELNLEVVKRQIRITRQANKYALDELLAGITKENLHQAIDFGRPVGKEAW